MIFVNCCFKILGISFDDDENIRKKGESQPLITNERSSSYTTSKTTPIYIDTNYYPESRKRSKRDDNDDDDDDIMEDDFNEEDVEKISQSEVLLKIREISNPKKHPQLENFGMIPSAQEGLFYIYGGAYNRTKLSRTQYNNKMYLFNPYNRKFESMSILSKSKIMTTNNQSIEEDLKLLNLGRFGHSMILRKGNKIIIFGGLLPVEYDTNLYEFDLITRRWEVVKFRPMLNEKNKRKRKKRKKKMMEEGGGDDELNASPRLFHHTALYRNFGDEMYVFGGRYREHQTLNLLYRYNFQEKLWKELIFLKNKNEVPEKRDRHSMDWIDGIKQETFMIFGGLNSSFVCCNDQWMFHVKEKKWEKMNNCFGKVPSPRYSHATCVHENNLYLFGGESIADVYNDVYSFNLITYQWKEFGNFYNDIKPNPVSHHKIGMFLSTFNGERKIFSFGGCDKTSTRGRICEITFDDANEIRNKRKRFEYLTQQKFIEYVKSDDNIDEKDDENENENKIVVKVEGEEKEKENNETSEKEEGDNLKVLPLDESSFFNTNVYVAKTSNFDRIRCFKSFFCTSSLNLYSIHHITVSLSSLNLKEDILLSCMFGLNELQDVHLHNNENHAIYLFDFFLFFKQFEMKEHMNLVLMRVKSLRNVPILLRLFEKSLNEMKRHQKRKNITEISSTSLNKVEGEMKLDDEEISASIDKKSDDLEVIDLNTSTGEDKKVVKRKISSVGKKKVKIMKKKQNHSFIDLEFLNQSKFSMCVFLAIRKNYDEIKRVPKYIEFLRNLNYFEILEEFLMSNYNENNQVNNMGVVKENDSFLKLFLWNNKMLYRSGKYANLKLLTSDGREFSGHKEILIIRTNFFFQLFKKSPSLASKMNKKRGGKEILILRLPNIHSKEMFPFLQFIYLNEVNTTDLLILLRLLGFAELYKEIELRKYLMNKIHYLIMRNGKKYLKNQVLSKFGYLMNSLNSKTRYEFFECWKHRFKLRYKKIKKLIRKSSKKMEN